MTRRGRPWAWAAPVSVALAFTSPAAADPTKDECVDANGKAQELWRDDQLSAAREQFRACSNLACPAMVRDDCAKRLDELDRVQPTMIFSAKTASGRDLSAVRVTMDGRPFAERLEGAALRVDPGEHAFTFTAADQPPVNADCPGGSGARSVCNTTLNRCVQCLSNMDCTSLTAPTCTNLFVCACTGNCE